MARIATTVHIVTTAGMFGKVGFTATSVISISDSPPTLLVCLNGKSANADILQQNGSFCINTLRGEDAPLSDIFAGRTGARQETRFTNGTWHSLLTGSPALLTSVVSFDCRLMEVKRVATHNMYVGQVLRIQKGPIAPTLIYQNREYASTGKSNDTC
jgi:flavin reductase